MKFYVKEYECNISEEDKYLLEKYNWYLHKTGKKIYLKGYLKGDRKSGLVYMHRLIQEGKEVDHIDGNGLNNLRSNLRSCDRTMNNLNRKNVRGAWFEKRTGKWKAEFWYKKKKYSAGRHNELEDAIAARVAMMNEIIPKHERVE